MNVGFVGLGAMGLPMAKRVFARATRCTQLSIGGSSLRKSFEPWERPSWQLLRK